MDQARKILKSVFGYEEFRSLQEQCIRSVLDKKDTLLVMPTGGGKSLCYQIPALIFKGLTVVVSPLISLMTDQVRQLKEFGVEAVVLNSSLKDEEVRINVSLLREAKARILFLAPETLLKEDILNLLTTLPVECITIDEAHCISDWGHDFRPEYRKLFQVRSRFPEAVCLAMTATATPRVRRDIRQNLQIGVMNEWVASFNRENLFYEVIPKLAALEQTVDFLKRFPDQSGIIYCFSRKETERLALALEKRGFSVRPYHAGLSTNVRMENQEQFIRDDVQIMVATIAFGMGIHKPNIRFVVHYDLPKNIESYYQETGRAGRDGLRAHCLLLFGYGNIQNIRHLIRQKTDETQKRVASMHLDAIVRYAENQNCRRVPLITYFGEEFKASSCAMCDNCTHPKDAAFDMTDAARKLLSCVHGTGQRFGVAHVVDVLRGAESEKILKFNHEKLSMYGSGREYSVKQWRMLAGQMLQKDLVRRDFEAYGALKLTARSAEVLKGETPVFGFCPPKEEKPKVEKLAAPTDYDESLFQILRKKRKALADAAHVPPYVIFSDKSLIDMAGRHPKTLEDFSNIYGVGVKKLETYGPIFIEVIREYPTR